MQYHHSFGIDQEIPKILKPIDSDRDARLKRMRDRRNQMAVYDYNRLGADGDKEVLVDRCLGF